MQPSMTSSEIAMVSEFMTRATHYAEFGSGGSTCLASKFPNIRSIISIESDHAFQQKVQAMCPRADVRWINIGRTSDYNRSPLSFLFRSRRRGKPEGSHQLYGHPADNSSMHLWRDYSTADVGQPDLILIDGRFRVACGIQCCLKYPNAIIMIHDFAHRTEYHPLLQFLDVFSSTDSLVVARVKPELDKAVLEDAFEKFVDDQN